MLVVEDITPLLVVILPGAGSMSSGTQDQQAEVGVIPEVPFKPEEPEDPEVPEEPEDPE